MNEVHPGDEGLAALILEARNDREAMGRLLEAVRPYLLAISNAELPPDLRAKIGASDVVQESLFEAVRDFNRFGGTTAPEFKVWIRKVLLNNLANWERWFRSVEKRKIEKEVPFGSGTCEGPGAIGKSGPSPSDGAKAAEDLQALREKMQELPDHYRQVLTLRHWQHLSFEQIGEIVERTPDAARMLWWRAVERLQELLGDSGGDKPLE